VFTRPSYWSLPWARWIQSTPSYHIPLRFTLILYFYLRLCLPVLFYSLFPTTIFFGFLVSPKRATCSVYFILIGMITVIIFGGECILWNISLCNFLLPAVTLSLCIQIFSSALCSQTLSTYSSLRDQVFHTYISKIRKYNVFQNVITLQNLYCKYCKETQKETLVLQHVLPHYKSSWCCA
jgi:hypothetical protein